MGFLDNVTGKAATREVAVLGAKMEQVYGAFATRIIEVLDKEARIHTLQVELEKEIKEQAQQNRTLQASVHDLHEQMAERMDAIARQVEEKLKAALADIAKSHPGQVQARCTLLEESLLATKRELRLVKIWGIAITVVLLAAVAWAGVS